MAYKNNGYQRATALTISVLMNGVVISSNQFPFMESFTHNAVTYTSVSPIEIQQMSTETYTARAIAYAAYVQANYQSQYPGLTVSDTGSRVYNDVACPIN
jgi:hypothetical protein